MSHHAPIFPAEILRALIRDHWPARALAMTCCALAKFASGLSWSRFEVEHSVSINDEVWGNGKIIQVKMPNGVMHGMSSITGGLYYLRANYHFGVVKKISRSDYSGIVEIEMCSDDPRIMMTDFGDDPMNTYRKSFQAEIDGYAITVNLHARAENPHVTEEIVNVLKANIGQAYNIAHRRPRHDSMRAPIFDKDAPGAWALSVIARTDVDMTKIANAEIGVDLAPFGAFATWEDTIRESFPGMLKK